MRAQSTLFSTIRICLTLGATIAGCSGGRAPAVADRPAPISVQDVDSCAAGPAGRLPRNLTVLFTDPIVPSVPGEARTRAERAIARHLYEPLIRVGCDGRILPALATSWRSADSGRVWIFMLRVTARFWDGTPVLAPYVLRSWAGYETANAPIPWAGIEQARALGDRQVMVYLTHPSADVPIVLADPRLAVSRPARRATDWPQGSTRFRPSIEDGTTLVVDPWDPGARETGAHPRSIEFRIASGAAARDLLDRGIDVLVTDNPSLLDYAGAGGQYAIDPLPWDQSYVLFVPAIRATDPPAQVPGDGFLDAVAREAVGGEARVPAGERAGAWQPDTCGKRPGTEPDITRQPRRVVYPAVDQTARELSQRLVTFAGAPGQGGDWLATAFRNPPSARSFPFAVGLEPAAWSSALHRGDEVAYVFSLPARAYTTCTPPPRPDGSWMGLIETRARLVTRSGIGGVSVDWDGTPVFGGQP